MATTQWEVIFADPELDPEVLLPLVEACKTDHRGIPDRWDEPFTGAWYALPTLWENPAFALMPLELPALHVLREHAERAWLDAQFGPLRMQMHEALGDTTRARSMPLMEEVMRRCGHLMHPLLVSLWSGRVAFPYFTVEEIMGVWPDGEWQKIFRNNRDEKVSTLEFCTPLVIAPLQYDRINSSIFFHAVQAYCMMELPLQIHSQVWEKETTQESRLFYAARLHLLDHVKNGTPIDWDIMRAPMRVPK